MCNYGILRAIFPNQEETPLLVNYGTRRGSLVVRRRRHCVGGPDMKMKWGHSVGKTRILSEICMFRMEFSIICDPKICKIAIHQLQLGLHFALFPGLFISRHVIHQWRDVCMWCLQDMNLPSRETLSLPSGLTLEKGDDHPHGYPHLNFSPRFPRLSTSESHGELPASHSGDWPLLISSTHYPRGMGRAILRCYGTEFRLVRFPWFFLPVMFLFLRNSIFCC